MGKVLDFFKNNPEVAGSIAKTIPAIVGFNQAAKSKKAIYGEDGYMQKLENIERGREQLVNPFESIENPYKNLSVATKAAEMQAEQTDIALANTLDTLRETGKGAGGATAIAQAALKSKQNVAASIEQQEAQNEKLKAQGQLQVDIAKGKGELARQEMQGARDTVDLNRTQDLIRLEQEQRAAGLSTGALSTASALGGLSTLIKPKAKEDEATGASYYRSGFDDTEFVRDTDIKSMSRSEADRIAEQNKDLTLGLNTPLMEENLDSLDIAPTPSNLLSDREFYGANYGDELNMLDVRKK